jgi:hypothetical protein
MLIEDQFIDSVVALEALFGDNSDGLPGGLTYKLVMRAAVFARTSSYERKQIFEKMRKALRLRGAVVHGVKSVNAPRGEDREVIEFVAAIARESLRKILLTLPSPNDFSGSYVDELIFSAIPSSG